MRRIGLCALLVLSACAPASPPPPQQKAEQQGRWRVVHTQPALDQATTLSDVAATGAGEAWAVGEQAYGTDGHQALLLRWDGHAWRRLVKEVPKRARDLVLTKVDAVRSGNVWVVAEDPEAGESGLLHHDGRRWSFIPGEATEVLAVGDRQAWTFGEQRARHFDGRRWTSHRTPVTGHAAAALSPRDIWVAGEAGERPAVMRFDGVAWTRSPLPAVNPPSGSSDARLTAILATGPREVWAAGGWATPEGTFRPLLYRWDGVAWHTVDVSAGKLTGIARGRDGALWLPAMGWNPETDPPETYRLLRYANGRWSSAAPPAPITAVTGVPGGPTLWGVAGDQIVRYSLNGDRPR
ncbi:hypothetical protein [Streptosporangium sp. KLBMP 9127]|nr:hypothetical protein [Streptosporangium sp. KLBMP 9127]